MRFRGILFPCFGILLLVATLCGGAASSFAADDKAERTLVIHGLGHGEADLDGPWQFHTGDDAVWAQPTLDDSAWESLVSNAPWGAQGHPSYTGIAWYRRHLNIIPAPGTEGRFQILLPHIDDSYEIYWNGSLIGSYGKLPPHPVWFYSPFPGSFQLTGATSGVLAIRVWKAPLDIFSIGEGGGMYTTPILGDPETISLNESAITWNFIQLELFEYSLILLRVFITALCIVLWSRNRRETLFIWVAIFTASPVTLHMLQGMFLIPFPYGLARCINQPLYVISNISLWFLLIWLLQLNQNRRVVRWTRILAWTSLVAGTADGVLALFWGSATLWMQWADGLLTGVILLFEVVPFFLIARGLRNHLGVSRWAVAMTAFLLQAVHSIADVSAFGQRFTHLTLFTALVDTPLFTIQGVDFQFEKVTSLALFASILFAVYHYVLEQQARSTALEREMQSAREIQQVLIPEVLPSLEGYAVTSAYTPAQEVGGDFFQILANSDGSTIVALGDVSGKGLKAAMNVATIVGILRAEATNTSSPGEILGTVNQCLAGRMQGGFATGLVFRLQPNGEVTIANAGHLPVFLNGKEFMLPPSLPLGVVGHASFEEVRVHVQPGDQLSIYTDGLLEARNAAGELFGFDRLRELFAQKPTAQEASEAALAFGQDDDITVLTLTRLAAGEESTPQLVTPMLEDVIDRA
jgi:serine phosphatase RsbU (regulator of sigma subunit)